MTMMNNMKKFTFEDIDTEAIENCHWAQSFKTNLIKYSDAAIDQWCHIVNLLGLTEEERNTWIKSFDEQIRQQYFDFVVEVKELKNKTVEKTEEYLSKIYEYEKVLNMKSLIVESRHDELGLSQIHEMVLRECKRLEDIINERKEQHESLMKKIHKLCEELEDACPIPINNDSGSSVPSEKSLQDLKAYIEQLNSEKFLREEQYYNIQEEIKSVVKRISYEPKNAFEKNILTESNSPNISQSFLTAMKSFHQEILALEKDMVEEINMLRQNIENLWVMLEISQSDRDRFSENNNECSLKSLNALRKEYKRCELLKKENIKVFIEKLRAELQVLWNKCFFSHNNSEYYWFKTDCYDEDCLQLHEMELKEWQDYYQQNEDLITLINKHKKFWNDLLALEEKSEGGKERYNNRGGHLLKEEKIRKKLAKNIPVMEENMLQLAAIRKEETGKPLLIFGSTIEDYLNNMHEEREQNRKLKLSTKKQKLTPGKLGYTPGKSCLSIYPSTSQATLVTPKVSAKRKIFATPGPIENTLMPQKKQKKNDVSKCKVLCGKIKSRKSDSRSSLKRKRRSLKHNILTNEKNLPNICIDDIENYSTFEENLSQGVNKMAAESTSLNVDISNPNILLKPYTTPQKCPASTSRIMAKTPSRLNIF